jgi:hypothetical protein
MELAEPIAYRPDAEPSQVADVLFLEGALMAVAEAQLFNG